MKTKPFRAIALFIALTALGGCSSPQSPPPPAQSQSQPQLHTHTPQEGWQCNAIHHWQLCQCGQQINTAPHQLDEDELCQGCGSRIWHYDDDAIDVYTYDQDNNPLFISTYTKDGTLISQTCYQRYYDDQGKLLRQLCFVDDVLIQEDIYTYSSEPGSPLSTITSHYQDSSSSLYLHDAAGNIILVQEINADGTVRFESSCEYAYDEEGRSYQSKCVDRYEDGSSFTARYNQYSEIIFREQLNADGTLEYNETFEYGYDQNGERLWVKEYENGRLVREIPSYAYKSDENGTWSYPHQVIDYFEDGGRMISTYDENLELAQETWYNADGSFFLELNYTYEYDDSFNYTNTKVYEGDRLINHKEFTVSPEGLNYTHTETVYGGDGSKTVYSYNQFGELIGEAAYNPQGNIIP